MKNAPVYYVLAQIRTNAVMALEQYVPAIQDGLRRAGYPDFQKTFSTVMALGAPQAGDQSASWASAPQVRYNFMNAQRTAGFVLDPTYLTFHTTHYDTFEPFVASLLLGLGIVNRHTGWEYSERIGLRYLDAAIPQRGEDVSQYVSHRFLGLTCQFKDRDLVHSACETRVQSGYMFMTSRVFVYKHLDNNPNLNVAFPPDFPQGADSLVLMDKFKTATGTYAMFDNDASWERRDGFDPGAISNHLKSLRDEIGRAFGLMASEHALKVWA